MNKKDILQSIKIIALGVVLSLGISFAYAQINPQWDPPTAAPTPANNVYGPVNVGSNLQQKTGNLYIGSIESMGTTPSPVNLLTSLGFSTNALVATGSSQFLGNMILGDSSHNPTLTLKQFNTNQAGGTDSRSICVNGAGTIVLCTGAISEACGVANGGFFTSVPTTELCANGSTASAVNGQGGPQTPSWNWTCSSAGVIANCTANMKIDTDFTIDPGVSPIESDEVKNLTSTTTGGYGNKTYLWTAAWSGQGGATFSNPNGPSPSVTLDKRPQGTGSVTYYIRLTVTDSASPEHMDTQTKVVTVNPMTHP